MSLELLTAPETGARALGFLFAPPATLDPQIETLLRERIELLTIMEDEEIIAAGHAASQMIACGFVIRGACALELQRRSVKTATGRGNRDVSGIGLTAQIRSLSARLGVSARTLYDDARIYRVFFAPRLRPAEEGAEAPEQEAVSRLPYGGLGRDHYRLALMAKGSPVNFLLEATEAGDGACTAAQIRERLREQRPLEQRGAATSAVPLAAETAHLLKTMLATHNQADGKQIASVGDYVQYLAAQEVKRSKTFTGLRLTVTETKPIRSNSRKQAQASVN